MATLASAQDKPKMKESHRISDFLTETEYCDISNPKIKLIATKIKNSHRTKKAAAVEIFYFVRDHVIYHVGNWQRTASETLTLGEGSCTNSANLFVALCRAAGIPAGYYVMDVLAPDYFGPIQHPKLKKAIAKKEKRSKHVYASVKIGSRWIRVDPSDDEPLSLGTQHLNPQSQLVNWDGETNAVLNIEKGHIIGESSNLANIDSLISKRQRSRVAILVYIGNLYLDFLRLECKNINDIDQLEAEFLKWLRKKSYVDYLLTRAVFFVIEITHKMRLL